MSRQASAILALIRNNYFTVGIFFCIILAELAPSFGAKEGPLLPEITVKYFAVFIIFFSSGLTINWKELSEAVKQYELHIFIQTLSFFYIPIFIRIILFVFEFVFECNLWIHKGLLIVGCMPPPMSSAVILVKSIGGNEAAAVFNSALGNILGILVTPVLLLFHIGVSSSVPILKTILQLFQTMVFPIFLGQLFQKVFSPEILERIPFSLFGQVSLLFIIYISFCDMFVQEDLNTDAHLILTTIFLVVVIQVVVKLSVFQIAVFVNKRTKIYTPQDMITTNFCSTHKSLTLGLPIIKTMYGGYSHFSQISLPLLIYHSIQLILGGFLIPYGRKWLKNQLKLASFYKWP